MAVASTGTAPGGELRRRVLAGGIAALLAVGALTAGGLVLWGAMAAVAVVTLAEWSALVGADRLRLVGGFAVLAAGLAFAAPLLWGTDRSTVALLLILALLLMLVPRSAGVAWGAAYVGTAAIGLLFLRAQPNGLALALWALLVVWATDIGAFFAGRRLGRRKLAPRISPGKTWEGLVGGMAAAAIVGGLFGVGTGLPASARWLGAPLAVVAQGGDLLESWLKRRAGVKDSGMLLPGHGGLLDRVDGALPVLILVAALVANGTF